MSTQFKCKLLISGCGGAGLNVARVATADGRATIVGLVDPSQANLQRAKGQYPAAQAGAEYERILTQTQPDAVVVASPDHLHAEQTLLALDHGCHVLVEKPLATTATDAQRIIAREAESGCQVMTDHTLRYVYPWREMALAAKGGQVGQIFFVEGNYIHDMWSHYSAQGAHHTPWRVDAQNPQNILLGGGCHPIDLLLWTVDAPVIEVYAYSNKLSIPDFPSDDCYIVIMRFANEVLGKVYVTSGCSGESMGQSFLSVYGTEGTLLQGQLLRRGQEPLALENRSAQNVVGGHGWGGAVVDFLDLLAGKIENPIPAQVGAKTVAVCEAALQAIEHGQPQNPVQF